MAATRSLSRHESDNDSTQYSLDLGALPGAADESLLQVADYEEHADQIHSEDIDGPSDFTQNMEYWMRGNLPGLVKPQKPDEVDLNEESRLDLEEYVSSEDSKDFTAHGDDHDDKENQPPRSAAKSAGTPGVEQRTHRLEKDHLELHSHKHDKVLSYLSELPDISASSDALGSAKPTPSPHPVHGSMVHATGSPLPARKSHPLQATVESFIETPRPDSRVTQTTDQTVIARPILEAASHDQQQHDSSPSQGYTSGLSHDISTSTQTEDLEILRLREELQQAREEIGARVAAQRANDQEILGLKRELTSVRNELGLSRKESERAIQEAREAHDATLSKQLNASNDSLSRSQSESTELRKELVGLQKELIALQDERRKALELDHKLQNLQDENTSLRSQLNEKEAAIHGLQASIADSDGRLQLQSDQHAEVRQRLLAEQQQREDDVQKLKANHQRTSLETEDAWKQERTLLQSQLDAMRKERDTAQAETMGAQRESLSLAQRLDEISQKHSTSIQHLEGLKTKSEAELVALQAHLEALTKAQAQPKDEARDAQPQESLQVKALDEALSQLRLSSAKIEGEKSALERMLQDSQARVDQGVSRSQHLERTIEALRNECNMVKDELRSTRENLEQVTRKTAELETSSSEANSQLERTQQELDKASRQSQTSQTKTEQLEGTIQELESNLSALASKLKQTEADLEDTRKQLDEAWQDADEARNSVKDAWELSGRERAAKDATESVKVEELQRQNTQLQARVKELLEKESDLVEDKLRLEAQLEADVDVDDKHEALEADLERLQDKMDAMEEGYKQRLSKASEDQDSMKKKISSLEKNLAAARRDKEEKRVKKAPVSDEKISKLEARCEGLQAQKDAAESAHDDLQTFLEAEQQAHHETSASLSAVTLELRSLRQDYDDVHRIMDEMISKAVKKREQEWQAKFTMLLEERKLMGRALMLEWGEKEFGAMEPKQGYNYRFLDL